MGTFERKVWTELRQLREAEATLQVMYETLHTAGADTTRSFISSLRSLDERARRLETILERAA
jgi:hypothetical protein